MNAIHRRAEMFRGHMDDGFEIEKPEQTLGHEVGEGVLFLAAKNNQPPRKTAFGRETGMHFERQGVPMSPYLQVEEDRNRTAAGNAAPPAFAYYYTDKVESPANFGADPNPDAERQFHQGAEMDFAKKHNQARSQNKAKKSRRDK